MPTEPMPKQCLRKCYERGEECWMVACGLSDACPVPSAGQDAEDEADPVVAWMEREVKNARRLAHEAWNNSEPQEVIDRFNADAYFANQCLTRLRAARGATPAPSFDR